MHFLERMLRAARLDPQLYEEVEADTSAMGQAMVVVLLSSFAAGIGMGGLNIGAVLFAAIGALIGWVVWAALTYVIGVHLLPEPQTEADVAQMLRTIGFAAAPGVLRVAGLVPGLLSITFAVAGAWMIVAMVIAVRQALDYRSTVRAVAVCVIGFVVQVAAFTAVAALFGIPAAAA